MPDERTWPLKAWHRLRRLNLVQWGALLVVVISAILWANGRWAAGLARELDDDGGRRTVTSSEVLLAENFERQRSSVAVIAVRVTVPGVTLAPELRWTNPPVDLPRPPGFTAGWVKAEAASGYAAPLTVRYRADGDGAVAMAQKDIPVAMAQDDGVTNWGIAVGGLLFLVASVPPWIRLYRRRRRGPALSP